MSRATTALSVHPVADLFPMLATDELAEMAADIKARGQLQPIVLDSEGRVLDGRNRLAACEIAEVEPQFETYDGDDPDGYALAVNITRRHLTTGARAILAEQARRLNGKSTRKAAGDADLHHRRIMDAGLVLDWAPARVPEILAGAHPLSTAVDEARAIKREADALQAKLARLTDSASDLRTLIDEGRMAVDDAIAALNAREQKAKEEAAERAAQQSQQETAEKAARQEALNVWNQASDYLTAALSYAKTYSPPADTDIYATVADFQRRVHELQQISDQWKDADGDE